MRPVVWEGYGHLNRRGLLRIVLHGLSQPPLEITVSGVAPRKLDATVFLVRVRRDDPPPKVTKRGFIGRKTE